MPFKVFEVALSLKMKTFILIMLAVSSAAAADLRNVNGDIVDLSPIYQWRQTNGPATNRPLAAWKEMQILQIGEAVSVYTRCQVVVEEVTNVVLVDRLPPAISKFLSDKDQLEKQFKQLESFIADETKRLRLVAVESANWDTGSAPYNQFLLDRATLANKKDDLEQTRRQVAEMTAKAPSAAMDFAIQMNKKYVNLEIWDFGLKR